MSFGDLDDAQSNVARLLRETEHFRLHEDLGTQPRVHYVWDGKGK